MFLFQLIVLKIKYTIGVQYYKLSVNPLISYTTHLEVNEATMTSSFDSVTFYFTFKLLSRQRAKNINSGRTTQKNGKKNQLGGGFNIYQWNKQPNTTFEQPLVFSC